MRALQFVTLGKGGGELLLASAEGDEHYVLPVDEELRKALVDDVMRQPGTGRDAELESVAPPAPAAPAPVADFVPTPHVPTPMTPREIQVRVRAGESPQSLAAACDMPLERVMRFAAAVIDERTRIAGEARRARARRTGADGSQAKLLMFGEAVYQRFLAHGIEPDAVSWDARRRQDGEWVVIAHWRRGEATHAAEWLFSRVSRIVTPLDDTAADLLSDRPIRPVLSAEPPRPSLSMAPPLMRGIVAFPPMPDADTGPVPRIDDVFDQEAAPEAPRDVPPLVPATAALDFEAPSLPLGITDPAARPSAAKGAGSRRNRGGSRREETEEQRSARARVPSWDDIVLGIKRPD